MRTLLEVLEEDKGAGNLVGVKVGGRYVVNDISMAIAEIRVLRAEMEILRGHIKEAAHRPQAEVPDEG